MRSFVAVVVLLLEVCLGMAAAERAGAFASPEGRELMFASNNSIGSIQIAQAGQSVAGATYKAVAGIIEKYHCTVCHIGAEPREGLRLDSYDNIMKGSEEGPVVLPGAPEKSELLLRVNGSKEPRMPMTGPPWLSDDEVKTLEIWINAGAKGPKS